MNDNSYLGERGGVHTPMERPPDRNGGFNRVDPLRLVLPPLIYGFPALTCEAQLRNPQGLYNWTRRILGTRARSTALGRGRRRLLEPSNRKVLSYPGERGDDHDPLRIQSRALR